MPEVKVTKEDAAALQAFVLQSPGPEETKVLLSLSVPLIQVLARHRLAAIEQCAKVAEGTFCGGNGHATACAAVPDAIRKLAQ